MRLFERQTYDFHWWTLILGKRIYPLTRAAYFLECPLIRDFTAFVSFPFSHAWAGHQCRISRTTSLPVFVVPKTVFPSDMVDSGWNRTWGILHYFAYQRAKLFAGNKITYTISLYLQNISYASPSHKPFGNELTKVLGTCQTQFLAVLQRCPSYLQELLEV